MNESMVGLAVQVAAMGLLAVAASPASASGPYVQEWRSASIVTTDGDQIDISPGKEALDVRLKVDGKTYHLENAAPPNLALQPNGIEIDFQFVRLGEAGNEKKRTFYVSVVTDRYDEDGSSVVETYVYDVLPSQGVCGSRLLDSNRTVLTVVRSCEKVNDD